MMSKDQHAALRLQAPRSNFTDVNPQETSRAWTRFLENRNAPSLPMNGVRSLIYQSWVRSRTTGIKPEQFSAPSLERNSQLAKSAYHQIELRRATHASMTRIGDLLSGAEAMLLLTDRDGVILETVGDKSTLTKAGKINLTVGGVWSESASGTNGIGTALWTGQPVYVHGEEHFCEGMKAWSCAAAPIHDPIDHSIIGVINLSGLTGIFQKHNAAFVATAARDIELALQQEQSLLNIRLMEAIIGKYPADIQQSSEGLAIVDGFGRLVFSRNSGLDVGRSDQDLGLGVGFLDLPQGISEENILSALPFGSECENIRLIEIEGVIKGAALAFKPRNQPCRHLTVPNRAAAVLPGIEIGRTGLKIVGNSEVILEAIDMANRVMSVNQPTLIEGQTGVGKELFARLIHSQIDPRNVRPFRTINCSAMTPQLLDGLLLPSDESEKLLPLCLDEVGETSADTQLLLLRTLEERMTRLQGPNQSDPSMHILSMTNRVLIDEVEAGRFRSDLFYRLSTVILTIPPLCTRGQDVLLIAEHFNRKVSIESGRALLIMGAEVQEALLAHSWPGNVRELRNLLSRLHGLAKSRTITLSDLPSDILVPRNRTANHSLSNDQRMAGAVSLKHAEVLLIENALNHHQGNLSKSAIALGISRPTLYRKIQNYGIKS